MAEDFQCVTFAKSVIFAERDLDHSVTSDSQNDPVNLRRDPVDGLVFVEIVSREDATGLNQLIGELQIPLLHPAAAMPD
jgi:hypothetical protein